MKGRIRRNVMDKSIGLKIKEARTKSKLNQIQLSSFLGIDQSNLSHNLKQSYYITINEQNTTYCVIFVTTINLMTIKLTAIKIAII